MLPAVFHTLPTTEFYFPERCHVIEIMNQAGIDFSIARVRVEPGVTTALHSLKGTTEAYYILSGSGNLELEDGTQRTVGSNDVVLFHADARQKISNIGKDDLIFLAICFPRFVPESYIHLEEDEKV